MKRFNFNKPLVESPTPPLNTDVLWVDIDESTGEVLSIKEFDNEWKEKINTDKGIPDTHKILYTTSTNTLKPIMSDSLIGITYTNNQGVWLFKEPVTDLKNMIRNVSDITMLTIPGSVTTISSGQIPTSVQNIVLKDGVQTITSAAFS